MLFYILHSYYIVTWHAVVWPYARIAFNCKRHCDVDDFDRECPYAHLGLAPGTNVEPPPGSQWPRHEEMGKLVEVNLKARQKSCEEVF